MSRRRAPRSLVAALLASTFVATPLPVRAAGSEPPMTGEARRHFERGSAHFARKDYAGASAEFEAAYRASPRSDILFGWAQALRLDGRCPVARPLYERLLAETRSPQRAAAIRESLALCEEQAPPPPPPEAAPAAPPVAEPPPPAPPPAEAPPLTRVAEVRETREERWYSDTLGGVLCGAGIAGLGAGAALVLVSAAKRDDVTTAPSYGDARARFDDASTLRTMGLAALGAGGALLLLGALRYATVGDRGPAVAVAPAAGGGALLVQGSF